MAKTKNYEVVKCECGHVCPINFAFIDQDGNYTCSNCYNEYLCDLLNRQVRGKKVQKKNAALPIFDVRLSLPDDIKCVAYFCDNSKFQCRYNEEGYEIARWYEVTPEQMDKIIAYCKGNEA